MVPGDNIGLTRVTLQGWGGADLSPPSLPLGVSSEHPPSSCICRPPISTGAWALGGQSSSAWVLYRRKELLTTQPQGMARGVHYQEKLHRMLAYQSCKEGLLTSHKQ